MATHFKRTLVFLAISTLISQGLAVKFRVLDVGVEELKASVSLKERPSGLRQYQPASATCRGCGSKMLLTGRVIEDTESPAGNPPTNLQAAHNHRHRHDKKAKRGDDNTGFIWQSTCEQNYELTVLRTAVDESGRDVEIWQPETEAEGVAQKFFLVTCSHPDEPCSSIQSKYESKCEQKYSLVSLRIRSAARRSGYYTGRVYLPNGCNCLTRTFPQESVLSQVFGL